MHQGPRAALWGFNCLYVSPSLPQWLAVHAWNAGSQAARTGEGSQHVQALLRQAVLLLECCAPAGADLLRRMQAALAAAPTGGSPAPAELQQVAATPMEQVAAMPQRSFSPPADAICRRAAGGHAPAAHSGSKAEQTIATPSDSPPELVQEQQAVTAGRTEASHAKHMHAAAPGVPLPLLVSEASTAAAQHSADAPSLQPSLAAAAAAALASAEYDSPSDEDESGGGMPPAAPGGWLGAVLAAQKRVHGNGAGGQAKRQAVLPRVPSAAASAGATTPTC